MFTGLIEGIGKVKGIQRIGRDMKLSISTPFDAQECNIGDSVAVDGVCLTVTELGKNFLTMDVSEETISRSTLGKLKEGSPVNMERALRLSDRLGGHLVLGHVDGIGRIVKKEMRQRSWLIRISIDQKLSRYTIEKGSIAVDGISLTINQCYATYFEVNIIPQTAKETTLMGKNVGDEVNIETDLIGKYIEKLLKTGDSVNRNKAPSGIDAEKLKNFGFGE